MKTLTFKMRNFVAKDLRTEKYLHKRQRTIKDFVRSVEKNKIRKELINDYAEYKRIS